MKTTLISNENNVAKFNMEFTADEFDGAVDRAYKKNRNRYQVNGFRRGKAPRTILERHYGEGLFFDDAINDLFGTGYPQAVDELDLEVVAQPEVNFEEIGHQKPLKMELTVQVYPAYEVKDYFGLDVDQVDPSVSDEDVDQEIEALRKRNARMVDVDREARKDDTVILDYAGFVGDDQFEGGTAEMQELKLGSGMFIPGFEDQLISAKKGDELDVNVTFPEKYQAEELAGKDAVFHCKIHDVKEEQLPELDDEFAKDVSEFDTLDELKADTRKNMEESRKSQTENTAKNELVDKIVEKNEVQLPAAMIEDEIDSMMNDFNQQLSYQGAGLDMYLKYTGSTREQFRDSLKDDARKHVAGRALLRSIATQEGVEATQEEIDEELQKMADQYKMEKEDLRKAMGKEYLRVLEQDIRVRKAMDLIFEKANVNIVEPPKPEDLEVKEVKAEDADKPAEADAAAEQPAEAPAEETEETKENE